SGFGRSAVIRSGLRRSLSDDAAFLTLFAGQRAASKWRVVRPSWQHQNNDSKISKASLKRFALNAVIEPCCEDSVSGDMDSRAKLIATLSAFALFCLLIATMPIGADTS